MDDGHFLIIVPIGTCFLPDLKPIITIVNCSSNMVAEGIGGQALGTVARQRQLVILQMPICS